MTKKTVPTDERYPQDLLDRSDLIQYHRALCAEARRLMDAKNHDYAGGKAEDAGGIWGNLEAVQAFDLVDVPVGILVRMIDKMSRLVTFAKGGKLKVADGGVHDTLRDLINYSILLSAYLQHRATVAALRNSTRPDEKP